MERLIRELQLKDHNWIDRQTIEGRRICEQYGVANASQLSPTNLDKIFHKWWIDESIDKASKENIVNCLGCLFGELLRLKFGSEWKIIADDFGTDLALQIVTPSHIWEIIPLAFVAKRVESYEDESGFFVGMESMLLRELGKRS